MIREFYIKQRDEYKDSNLIPFSGRQSRDNLLLFENPADREMSYSINVEGGHLLIDLNHLKRIVTLQLGIYRRSWDVSHSSLPRPESTVQGCLEFVNIESRISAFDELPLRTYTDKSQSAVKIEIGDDDRTNSLWVAISKYCLAELVENYLVGFWIDISDY